MAIIQVGGTSSDPSIVPIDSRQPSLPRPGEPIPRVRVDQETYDFGAMERDTTRSHEFLFQNVGQGRLQLTVGDTTCKCAVGKVSKDSIEPGETVPVRLEWTAKTESSEFRQSATIFTNDPDRRRITLTVFGRISQLTSVAPPVLHFDRVSLGQSKTAEVFVMSHHVDRFSILGHEFIGIDTPEHFVVAIERVNPTELPDPLAKDGYRVRVTVKETAPFGVHRGWLRIATDLQNAEKMDIPVSVRITTEISVFGKYYNEASGILQLGAMKSTAGAKATLLLVMRGEHANDVTMKLVEKTPDFLVAELGERSTGEVARIPLTVWIPPGSPPAAFVGGMSGKLGRIVLETTHPNVPRLEIKVQFIIED
ncbi:MAG: DUF1573 domain-containing protein [Pirellulales bacterium]|nr:DUF1573 domain-containing protein [Pirellulales bacterium]